MATSSQGLRMAFSKWRHDPSNAVLEWQARGLGRRSQGLVVACPLEGLVRSVAFPQETSADIRRTRNTQATSDTSSAIPPNFMEAFNLRSCAEMPLVNLIKLEIRSPERERTRHKSALMACSTWSDTAPVHRGRQTNRLIVLYPFRGRDRQKSHEATESSAG